MSVQKVDAVICSVMQRWTHSPLSATDELLKALDEQGMAVVPKDAIEQLGDIGDTCTRDITGRICPGCRCDHRASVESGTTGMKGER